MTQALHIPVFIRPLSAISLEEQLPANVSHEPCDVAMMFLSELLDNRDAPLDVVRKRYREVSDPQREPFVVPNHDAIMRHVIRPLREAKQCYVLGMAVACIAQAGLVGEMVALWRFRMLDPKLDGRSLDDELQKLLFGHEFDRMGQEERIRVLRALETLDDETIKAFGDLRGLRRQYLHFMVDSKRDIDRDARDAVRNACLLVTKTLDMSVINGKVSFPPKIMRYIRDVLHAESTGQPASVDGEEST